jgi:uncharacterized protein (TIGR02145 family)
VINSKTTDGTGTGDFTSNLTGLIPCTIYHIRAYATNSSGTTYGNDIQFTTGTSLPTITTTSISAITSNLASSGGTISGNCSATVTARGVCWSTNHNPTLANSHTTDGSGAGSFTSGLTELTANTLYYVMAYATNSVGTAYGNEVSFTTLKTGPIATTNTAADVVQTSAVLNGSVNANNDVTSIYFEYGLTTSYGTISNAIPGSLSSSTTTQVKLDISGLTSNTLYHFRVWAQNSAGTAYGSDMTFTTAPMTVTDIDGNVYNAITIGGQVWMKENLKTTQYNVGYQIPYITDDALWVSTTSPAYCWYNNDISNKDIYGALYNGYAIDTGLICPTGWHVPSDAEWTTLATYLGGVNVAGGKMKETGTTHWQSPNTGADNSSSFTGLPGGCRYFNPVWIGIGSFGYWWSSTHNSTALWIRRLSYGSSNIDRMNFGVYGFSVRCIKD